jgi:hypothetical protein
MDASTQAAEGKRTAPARSAVAARAAIAAALFAAVILVIILITGGFTVRAGLLRVTAHNWHTPLLITLIGFGAAGLLGRAACVGAASDAWVFVDAHAPAIAVVIAATTAAVGVAHGTYSASSSDASGYVSEARLLAGAHLAIDEPLAREVAWPNATWAFTPLGYRPGSTPGELVPTYPAGLPLTMVPARLAAGELAGFLVLPLLGAIAVLATYGAGARLHSRSAGIAAALLLATSPIFLFQLVQPMSDVPVTAWWAVALWFALLPIPNAALASGGAAGLAVLTRPNLLPMALVVGLAAANLPRGCDDRRARPDRALAFVAGIVPAIGAQLLMQWRLYGSPLASGYGSAGDLFGFGNIGPNLSGYTTRILRGEGPALMLALSAVIVLAAARRRRADAPRLKQCVMLTFAAASVVLASYLPYAVFAEWSYLRFLLPAFPLAFIVFSALLVNALLRLPTAARAPIFALALTIVASFNIVHAQEEQAFSLQRYESRYRLAGAYLQAALPPAAVVVTVQESGSARYYADVPILRWDQIDVDFDGALAALRAIGRHPVLLVEDWEAPQLAAKFPRSAVARADWMPRAEFGDEIRVYFYDPADRNVRRTWRADRVH